MNILLSNDDGFNAPGINLMRDHLSQIASVLAIAPDRDRSGSSNSLTLETPLRITERGEHFYSVNGTPTDCVHLALTGLYEEEPDIVVSGINSGPNMGDDVIYSGTVAAAMEGRNLGLPALAVSMASHQPQHYHSAVRAVTELLQLLPDFSGNASFSDDASFPSEASGEESISLASILNVNVPDIPFADIKGFQVTRLGKRHKAEPVIRTTDPRGDEIFWVGPPGEEKEEGEGTDFYAVQNGFISVTPLHIDLTQYSALQSTQNWLSKL